MVFLRLAWILIYQSVGDSCRQNMLAFVAFPFSGFLARPQGLCSTGGYEWKRSMH
jgi:hypothetical protein